MPGGGFPIRNAGDLANAKQSIGRAKNPAAARRWIDKRAKALGKPGIGKASGGRAKRQNGGPTQSTIMGTQDTSEMDQNLEEQPLLREEGMGAKPYRRGGDVEGKAKRPHLGRAKR
jgi:hypothetical protein